MNIFKGKTYNELLDNNINNYFNMIKLLKLCVVNGNANYTKQILADFKFTQFTKDIMLRTAIEYTPKNFKKTDNYIKIIKTLLKNNADIHFSNNTPIRVAMLKNKIDLVLFLLKQDTCWDNLIETASENYDARLLSILNGAGLLNKHSDNSLIINKIVKESLDILKPKSNDDILDDLKKELNINNNIISIRIWNPEILNNQILPQKNIRIYRLDNVYIEARGPILDIIKFIKDRMDFDEKLCLSYIKNTIIKNNK